MASKSAPVREWTPPQVDGLDTLYLYNSLVDEKVPFVPAAGSGSKSISWYACGPTVYDSAHVGHARNYVAFDVIRRILEDYFGYSILYVMNVTDVDDKIIARARRNYLLQQYKQQAKHASQVAELAEKAIAAAEAKQAKKLDHLAAQLGSSTDSRQKTDLDSAFKNEKHKQSKLQEAREKFQQLKGGAAPLTVDGILAVAGDEITELLDVEQGAAVSEQAIFREHAQKYEREFFEDMDTLGVRRPDVTTRVVEFIPEIIAYVQRIIDNGMAYESNGSVYFDTNKFTAAGHVYGKCKPTSVGNATLASESEANFETQEKRSGQDFALWKAAKPGEPFWDSPWGQGRPGWHIECSAMASSIIGAKMDIHSGGEDLKFPHHDNELAQAEAFYHHDGCRQWVNYFLHSGHLEIEGLKMSKSLKNFITIREVLQQFSPRQLRLMFLMQPWNKTMNYGESSRAEMRAREQALKNFFQNVEVAVRSVEVASASGKWQKEEQELSRAIQEAQTSVHESFKDNLNTAAALDALAGLVKATNLYLASKQEQQAASAAAAGTANGNASGVGGLEAGQVAPLLLRKAAAFVTRILSVMGIVQGPGDNLGFTSEGEVGTSAAVGGYLDAFAAFRDEVRNLAKAKAPVGELLAVCDSVRDDTLPALGVRLEDRPDGKAIWKLDDPAVLAAEREERKAAAAAAAAKKLANLLDKKEKELKKYSELAALPAPAEALAGKYSRFDEETGEPTHDKEGNALEGKALDKARKDLEKVKKVREPLAKRLAEEPGFLEALAAEVAELKVRIAAAS